MNQTDTAIFTPQQRASQNRPGHINHWTRCPFCSYANTVMTKDFDWAEPGARPEEEGYKISDVDNCAHFEAFGRRTGKMYFVDL